MKTREDGKSNRTATVALKPLGDDELSAVSGGAETVKLSYSAIEWTYTKQKADGTAGGNVAAKWNVAQGAAA